MPLLRYLPNKVDCVGVAQGCDTASRRASPPILGCAASPSPQEEACQASHRGDQAFDIYAICSLSCAHSA